MKKQIDHFNNSKALTKSLLAWISDPDSRNCSELQLSSSTSLDEEASDALVGSDLGGSITKLEFDEIFLSTEQLEKLLTLAKLEQLRISGGVSYDGYSAGTISPTIHSDHIEVLKTSIDAQRLNSLILDKQNLDKSIDEDLRRALPNLKILNIFNEIDD